MNDALHKCKEREFRDKWIKRKHNDMFRDSSTLALHPRLHHRVGFPIHYLPPREPLPKRICTTMEYLTPLSNNHLTTEG